MTTSQKALWNLTQAAKACGLEVYTLTWYCRSDVAMRRRWKARKLGRRWYVDVAAFSAWLDGDDSNVTTA